MPKITKDTTLDELLDNPKAVKILTKYNLPCLNCPYAQYEVEKLKLGQVCKMYNINPKALLAELNKL